MMGRKVFFGVGLLLLLIILPAVAEAQRPPSVGFYIQGPRGGVYFGGRGPGGGVYYGGRGPNGGYGYGYRGPGYGYSGPAYRPGHGPGYGSGYNWGLAIGPPVVAVPVIPSPVCMNVWGWVMGPYGYAVPGWVEECQ